jgi:cellobiose transport system permease protein
MKAGVRSPLKHFSEKDTCIVLVSMKVEATVQQKATRLWHEMKRYKIAYLFISPFFILWLIFGLFPLLWSLQLSFTRWDGFSPMKFIGLTNYERILTDPIFWQAVSNTIYLWLGHIVIMFALALFLAVVLNMKSLRGKVFFRMVWFMPYVVGTAGIALVFGLVFDQHYGPLNAVLGQSIPWLVDADWTKITVIIFNNWQITGFWLLLLLAALQGIDPGLYEAAMIDGANALQRFRHITIPGLAPVLFFTFILETTGSIRIFTQPFVLYGAQGGPAGSSLSIVMYLYNNAFGNQRYGYASAVGWILFVMLIAVSVLQIWRGRRQALEIS